MNLSEQQGRIHAYMLLKGLDVDVQIDAIFDAMKVSGKRQRTSRDKQQHVGSAISRLNAALRVEGYEIVPGAVKRTYRLTRYAAS